MALMEQLDDRKAVQDQPAEMDDRSTRVVASEAQHPEPSTSSSSPSPIGAQSIKNTGEDQIETSAPIRVDLETPSTPSSSLTAEAAPQNDSASSETPLPEHVNEAKEPIATQVKPIVLPTSIVHEPEALIVAAPSVIATSGHPSNNKLSRWLSRGSNDSSTSSNGTKDARRLLRRTSNPNTIANDNTLTSQPIISVSPSSSAHSRLSSRSNSPVQTRRSSASSEKEGTKSSSVPNRALGALSFKSLRKGKGTSSATSDEVLEDWAEANYDESTDQRSITQLDSGSKSEKAANTNGAGGRFSLRKTRSKLFGRAENQEERESVILEEGPGNSSHSNLSPARRSQKASSSSALNFGRKKMSTAPVDVPPAAPRSEDLGFDPADFNPSSSPGDPFGSISSSTSPNNNSVGGRIGGWFNSMLNSNNNSSHNLPLSNEPSSSPGSATRGLPRMSSTSSHSLSPSKRGSTTSINGGLGRLGPLDRFLDKTAQFFLDSDSRTDQCEDDIWLLGVRHPGYRSSTSAEDEKEELTDQVLEQRIGELPPSPSKTEVVPSKSEDATFMGWPFQFYHDFYSRIALTYRSGFPPIPCSPSIPSNGFFNALSLSIGKAANGRTTEGLTSDSGWGCMLRTGQSLLANALISVHLGRDWRRPLPISNLPSPNPSTVGNRSSAVLDPSFATYSRILSLFIDDPSPVSPFSVHRFALMGKQLGKEVGEWFGPSTAMGAIKSLVNDFEPAGLSVVGVNDGTIYRSEVEAAASTTGDKKWNRPVLILIGLRLGIEGVNPIYHEAIKGIFKFPQSVGIAGGRPSSSYYFVGAQANSLFYIDPHHPKPSIALKQPPSELFAAAQSAPLMPNEPASTSTAALSTFFLDAYPDSSLGTYHCDKVRKMALASLDPSMLLGFLIRDESDWLDFSSRVTSLSEESKSIFTIADEPPAWMRKSTGAMSSTTTVPPVSAGDHVSADEFSEPDDVWELESTEASGVLDSSPKQDKLGIDDHEEDDHDADEDPVVIRKGSIPPIKGQKESETEDWVEENAHDHSPMSSVAEVGTSSSPADDIEMTSSSVAGVSTIDNPETSSLDEAIPPRARSPSEDLVHVAIPPNPSSSLAEAGRYGEEGWEGVDIAARASSELEHQTPRPSSDSVFVEARDSGEEVHIVRVQEEEKEVLREEKKEYVV